MNPSSRTFFTLARIFVFSLVLLLPLGTQAAGLFSTDPIFPEECTCDGAAPDYGCVLQVAQNAINFAITIGILLTVFYIAWAGAKLILNPTNAGARTKAKDQILNAVIGIVVILCSWLIVDFVMKYLYNPEVDYKGNTFGPWNSILADDGTHKCIVAKDPVPISTGIIDITTTAPNNSGSVVGYSSKLGTGSGACSPTNIQSAAAQGGYTLTSAQANTFSCLAIHESSCGRNTSIPTTKSGAQTSARGMFQITLGANDTCHSLNIPVCTQAAKSAGWSGSGNLNCSQAYRGGRVRAGQETLARACEAAAQNVSCNASAAACLLKQRPSFSDWTADSRASAQGQCIAKYNI